MGELTGEGREREGEGERWARLGRQGGCRREAWFCSLFCVLCVLAVHEKKVGGRRREEKREKRKEEGKEKRKRKKEKISNMEIFGKNKR
jgi:hypothetical protein